jgi:hypothetical protein
MNTYAEILVYCSHDIFKRVRKTVYNVNTSNVAVLLYIGKINTTKYDVIERRTYYVKKGALDITVRHQKRKLPNDLNARK